MRCKRRGPLRRYAPSTYHLDAKKDLLQHPPWFLELLTTDRHESHKHPLSTRRNDSHIVRFEVLEWVSNLKIVLQQPAGNSQERLVQ